MLSWLTRSAAAWKEDGIRITAVAEEEPRFKRVYSATLDNHASVEIEIRRGPFRERMADGKLTQRDGRYVLFDPKRIADKILDPGLVPLVQVCVDKILRMDRAFAQGDPSHFVDERGVKWQRVNR